MVTYQFQGKNEMNHLKTLIICILILFTSCDSLDLYKFVDDMTKGPRFLSFIINNRQAAIDLTSKTVYVNLNKGTDLTALTPIFTIFGEVVEYDGTFITSGTATVDFTSPRIFTVVGKYGTSRSFTVTVDNTFYPLLGVYHVSSSRGDDENIGSPDFPLLTISKAIERALPSSSDVAVEGGNYTETIIIRNGVSISGNWNSDFTAQSESSYIIATDSNGAIQGSELITTDTVIESLYIHSVTTGFAVYAIGLIDGACPTIRNCSIVGYAANTMSCGIYINNANPIIERNFYIYGGTGTTGSSGIYVTNASPVIRNNIILGGDSSNTSGIMLHNGGNAVIHNNNIDAGSGSGSAAHGIYINIHNPYIVNNIIYHSGAASNSYGIWENSATGCNPNDLRNNNVHSGFVTNYRDGDLNPYDDLDLVTINGIPSGNDNSTEPMIIGDTATNMDTRIVDGGVDLNAENWGFNNDIDNTTRVTGSWSVGAHEF